MRCVVEMRRSRCVRRRPQVVRHFALLHARLERSEEPALPSPPLAHQLREREQSAREGAVEEQRSGCSQCKTQHFWSIFVSALMTFWNLCQAEAQQQKCCDKFEKISETARDELASLKKRRIQHFRKNLVDLTELELKHAKVNEQLSPEVYSGGL